jgi:hypothetical protein
MSDLAKIKAANNKTLSVLKVLVLAVFKQKSNSPFLLQSSLHILPIWLLIIMRIKI